MSTGTWESRMTPRPRPLPRLDRLAVRWRVESPSHRVYECVECVTEYGHELRVQRSDDDLVISQWFAGPGPELDRLAETWRRGAIAKGFAEIA